MSLRYHNLLASMEDEKELEELNEEETEAGAGDGEDVEINIDVKDGDVEVETSGEKDDADTDEEEPEEEPKIDPPSDEDDEADAEIGQIEEDVEEAEGDIEETEDNIEQLDDVAEELDEAEEALEAMAAADDVPAYAEKLFMDKLSHISRRTGAQFRMVSSESHKGSKFKDYVFVDSLESSLKDTAKRVGAAIMELINRALEGAKRVWDLLTDATRRINARAKKAKKALKDMDFNREFAQERAEVIVKKHKTAISYATVSVGGDTIGFNSRLVSDLQKYEENYNKIFKIEFEFGKTMIDMLRGKDTGDSDWEEAAAALKEVNKGAAVRAAAVFTAVIVDQIKDQVNLEDVLPGGQVLTSHTVLEKASKGKKLRQEALVSDDALATGLASFAQRKGALDDLADFVIGLTEPSAKFTKEFEETQRQWFSEMEKAAREAAAANADETNKDEGRVARALDKFGATQLAAAATKLCYANSKNCRKAWIKTLHGCNVILAGYASGKAVKEDDKAAAA